MMMLKKTLFALAALASIWMLAFLARTTMHHFTTDRLISTLPYNPDWEIPSQDSIDSILQQPFYYYDKGGQSWVFISQDGSVILKFLDFRLAWRDLFIKMQLPSFLIPEITQRQMRSIKGPIEGYALASKKEFSKECGLIALFLNGKHSGITSLSVESPIHCRHLIDLRKASFVLQKKADSTLVKTLSTLVQNGKVGKARELLEKVLLLVAARCSHGMIDRDVWRFEQNIGFIGEEPIYLDAGSFSEESCVCNEESKNKEVASARALLIKNMRLSF